MPMLRCWYSQETPIQGDYPDAGMGLCPQGDGLGRTIGHAGERSPPLESDQLRPITVPRGPVINAEHRGYDYTREGPTAQ